MSGVCLVLSWTRPKNVDKHVCYLGQSGIGLPNKDYYFNENKKSVLEAYRNHVLKGFEILGN